LYKQAIRNNPRSYEANFSLADTFHSAKMYDEAIDSYQTAISINPMKTECHYNMGMVYRDKGDYAKAASSFERAVQLNGKNADAHYELGMIYYRHLKNNEKALSEFEKVLAIRPDHDDADKIRSTINLLKQ
ncbi:MAG TPA: tetratricopeptide repeat protein, partial [Spirochaetota bacterium]|nr:tetratricopeptide repeat protein [Spirochaetota bacterium]